MGDFSGEILSEVSAPLAEKPVYTTPITLPNGNRYKVENKIKVIARFNMIYMCYRIAADI